MALTVVCRSFLALELKSLVSPGGLVVSVSPLPPRTRDARIRQALDLVEMKLLLLLLPLPWLLLL